MFSFNFNIIGDKDKLIFISENGDNTQTAYIIKNPFIRQIDVNQECIEVGFLNSIYREHRPGFKTLTMELQSGEFDVISGKNLQDMFDPVMQKTVQELLSVINKKLDDREEKHG